METNKGISKFLRILEKDAKRADKLVRGIIEEKKNKAILSSIDKDGQLDREEYAQFLTQTILNLLSEDEKDIYECYRLIETTLYILKEKQAFNEFPLLEEFFIRYNLEAKYQVEVLGYIIRANINAFIETETLLKDLEQKLNDSAKATEEFFKQRVKELNIGLKNGDKDITLEYIKSENFKETMGSMFRAYNVLNKYVTSEGMFIATQELEEFFNALEATKLNLLPEQKMLIINDITTKRVKELLSAEFVPETEKKETTRTINMVDKKAKHQAAQILKLYLKEEKPVKLILEEEMLAITNALIELNYTDEQITKIQKGIIRNNNDLTQEQVNVDYKNAKTKYLSAESVQVLESVEKLIGSSETISNPLYKAIKDNYELAKEELMKLFYANDDENPEAKYSIEFINVVISEIGSLAYSYCYSDYRFARELSKKDN